MYCNSGGKMRNISLEKLTQIFDKGLNGEVRIVGHITAHIHVSPEEYMGFTYNCRGVAITKPKDSIEYKITPIDIHPNTPAPIIYFTKDKPIEIFPKTNGKRTYEDEYIKIPISDNPSVYIQIENIGVIKY